MTGHGRRRASGRQPLFMVFILLATAGGCSGRQTTPDLGGGQRDSGGGPGDGPAAADVGSGTSHQCTLVIGFSQTNQWFTAGFEAVVPDARWQLLWNGGAGVDRWRSATYSGWSNALVSPCAAGSSAPSRVVLTISGPYGSDEAAWAQAITATVTVIKAKYPAAKQILLQPVVGGPGHKDCLTGSTKIRASWQHKHIDAAIAKVVGGPLSAGFSPEVTACGDYKDSLGHLTTAGAAAAAKAIGAYYLTR
jgi:hypothetical protein